jgi:transposase
MPNHRDPIKELLGLPDLEVLEIEERKEEIFLKVKRSKNYEVCPECGKTSGRLHSQRQVKVRDLPMFGKKSWLLVTKRRYRCEHECEKPFPEYFHSLEKYKRQTKRYRNHLEASCRHSSISVASRKEGVSYKLLDRLYFEKAGSKAKGVEGQELPKVLGIDEFSGRRGVRLHMCLTDLGDVPKLWDVFKEKSCLAFIEFFKRYSKEARDSVLVVVHDMDNGIKSWSATMFQKAIHVVDKFHLVRTLLKYLERVRKAAYRSSQSEASKKKIRSAYFLIKRRKKKMGEKELKKLEGLFEVSKSLREAYEVKEQFMEWYDRPKRRAEAESELIMLKKRLREMPHMKRFTGTLEKWWEEILNYFALQYTNAFTEGMNNKIKTLKRQAYGFRNFERFRTRILNECAFN